MLSQEHCLYLISMIALTITSGFTHFLKPEQGRVIFTAIVFHGCFAVTIFLIFVFVRLLRNCNVIGYEQLNQKVVESANYDYSYLSKVVVTIVTTN